MVLVFMSWLISLTPHMSNPMMVIRAIANLVDVSCKLDWRVKEVYKSSVTIRRILLVASFQRPRELFQVVGLAL